MWCALTGKRYTRLYHQMCVAGFALRFGCPCQRGPSGVLVKNEWKIPPAHFYHSDGMVFPQDLPGEPRVSFLVYYPYLHILAKC